VNEALPTPQEIRRAFRRKTIHEILSVLLHRASDGDVEKRAWQLAFAVKHPAIEGMTQTQLAKKLGIKKQQVSAGIVRHETYLLSQS